VERSGHGGDWTPGLAPRRSVLSALPPRLPLPSSECVSLIPPSSTSLACACVCVLHSLPRAAPPPAPCSRPAARTCSRWWTSRRASPTTANGPSSTFRRPTGQHDDARTGEASEIREIGRLERVSVRHSCRTERMSGQRPMAGGAAAAPVPEVLCQNMTALPALFRMGSGLALLADRRRPTGRGFGARSGGTVGGSTGRGFARHFHPADPFPRPLRPAAAAGGVRDCRARPATFSSTTPKDSPPPSLALPTSRRRCSNNSSSSSRRRPAPTNLPEEPLRTSEPAVATTAAALAVASIVHPCTCHFDRWIVSSPSLCVRDARRAPLLLHENVTRIAHDRRAQAYLPRVCPNPTAVHGCCSLVFMIVAS